MSMSEWGEGYRETVELALTAYTLRNRIQEWHALRDYYYGQRVKKEEEGGEMSEALKKKEKEFHWINKSITCKTIESERRGERREIWE
jgi:hypothetical protein